MGNIIFMELLKTLFLTLYEFLISMLIHTTTNRFIICYTHRILAIMKHYEDRLRTMLLLSGVHMLASQTLAIYSALRMKY